MRKRRKSGGLYALAVIFFLVTAMTTGAAKLYRMHQMQRNDSPVLPPVNEPVSSEEAPASVPEQERQPVLDETEQRVRDLLSKMSLEEKVGQLFMVRGGDSGDIFTVARGTKAGSAALFADDFKGKSPDAVRSMIATLQVCSDGKMLIAVDEEGGTVVRVSSNSQLRKSKFLSPRRLYAKGGFELIASDTAEKCELLKSLSINMNLAPVADVCTKSSGFMYQRAFGKDENATAQYVTTVVQVMDEHAVASCVKHFPGYGNSKADTHKGLDVNEKSLDELKACDLVPFMTAIENHADSIMLTHTIIKAIDVDRPASLSPAVVQMIRGEMGFDGVLMSDGLEMGAILDYCDNDSGKACVMAVNAGLDMLCAPKNPVVDYQTVLAAVNAGEIPESRIDEAVGRIIRLKIKIGLYD